jgi:hypothetical protein
MTAVVNEIHFAKLFQRPEFRQQTARAVKGGGVHSGVAPDPYSGVTSTSSINSGVSP